VTYSRQDIVDAYAAYYEIHTDPYHDRVRNNPRLRDLCSVTPYSRDETSYETLSRLEPSALQAYFGLVDKLRGRDAANEALNEYARVGWNDGVTVYVTNGDSDPFEVRFHVQDSIANDWADAHRSLDGGTWERADSDFVYDTGQWHSTLFADLQKEGYDLDLSSWSDPDEDDHAAARHASNCSECQDHWDWDRVREHMKEPLVEVAREIISREAGWEGSF